MSGFKIHVITSDSYAAKYEGVLSPLVSAIVCNAPSIVGVSHQLMVELSSECDKKHPLSHPYGSLVCDMYGNVRIQENTSHLFNGGFDITLVFEDDRSMKMCNTLFSWAVCKVDALISEVFKSEGMRTPVNVNVHLMEAGAGWLRCVAPFTINPSLI